MNCTDFELAIQERLDRRDGSLTEELRAHVDTCAACRSFRHSQQTLLRAVAGWSNLELPSGLVEAVSRELSTDKRPASVTVVTGRVSSRSDGWVAVCSTAALALFAATLIGIGPTREPSRPNVAASIELPAQPPESTAMSGLLTGVQTEYAALSQTTTRVLDEWSELPRTPELIPALSDPAGTNVGESPAWLRIDRPVSDRVGQAFDFLWDVLPQDATRSS